LTWSDLEAHGLVAAATPQPQAAATDMAMTTSALPLCLQCREDNKARALKRGLCQRCYMRSQKDIKAGKTTWSELEAAGLALPAQERGAAWWAHWNRRSP
jgi:hypothetical protein